MTVRAPQSIRELLTWLGRWVDVASHAVHRLSRLGESGRPSASFGCTMCVCQHDAMRIVGVPLVCLTIAASSLILAEPVRAAELMCLGKTATIAQHRGAITGTPFDDVIVLTGRGRVDARGGNDIVCGSPAADVIAGGPGNDVVLAGAGNDIASGGPGNDQLHGEVGDDALTGGPGADQVFGAVGTDKVSGGVGPDTISQDGKVVLINVNSEDLEMLRLAGRKVAFAAGPRSAAQVVWASASPTPSMSFVLGSPYLSGFAAEPTTTKIKPIFEAPVFLGVVLNLGSRGAFYEDIPNKSVVQLVNNTWSAKLMGLLSRVIVNGSTTMGPVSVTELQHGKLSNMTPPTSAVLFTSERENYEYFMYLPSDAIEIDLNSGSTASFVYEGGRFRRS